MIDNYLIAVDRLVWFLMWLNCGNLSFRSLFIGLTNNWGFT